MLCLKSPPRRWVSITVGSNGQKLLVLRRNTVPQVLTRWIHGRKKLGKGVKFLHTVFFWKPLSERLTLFHACSKYGYSNFLFKNILFIKKNHGLQHTHKLPSCWYFKITHTHAHIHTHYAFSYPFAGGMFYFKNFFLYRGHVIPL